MIFIQQILDDILIQTLKFLLYRTWFGWLFCYLDDRTKREK